MEKIRCKDSDAGRPEDAVARLIEYIGDNPLRGAVQETPKRVLDYYDELRTQAADPVRVTTFPTDNEDLIVIRDIPVFGLCEHHMLPYYGVAHVGYIPHGQVIGMSKVPRLIAKMAAGLTIQERLTGDVAKVIQDATGSTNVGVVISAVHTCMVMRGAKAVGSETVTSAMHGLFRESVALRAEFLALADRRR